MHGAPLRSESRNGPKCRAKTKSGGECRNPAGFHTDHPGFGRCYFHFGTTPTGIKAAQRIAATNAVATYGLPREIDPWMALLEEVHRTAGHVAWLGLQVAEQNASLQDIAVAPWLGLYQAERAHLVRVARAAVEVGVAERQVRLAEAQGALLATVMRGILDELGHADDPRVDEVVQRHLGAVIEAQTIEGPSAAQGV